MEEHARRIGRGWAASGLLTSQEFVPQIRVWEDSERGWTTAGCGPFGIDWGAGTFIGDKLHMGRVWYGGSTRAFNLWADRIYRFLRKELQVLQLPEAKYKTRLGRHALDWYKASKERQLVYIPM